MFSGIPRRAAGALPLLLILIGLCACQPSQVGHIQAIVGAVLLDGQGGPPMSDSVVVVGGGRILAAGPRSAVSIPEDADEINGASRYLMPGLIDVCERADPPGMVRASTPQEARAQVERLAAAHTSPIHMAAMPKEAADPAIEAARAAGIPVIAHISTYAEAQTMLAAGAAGFVGMVRDREVDPAFAARARDLRIFFAPALGQSTQGEEMARRNTLLLFHAGAPLAVASAGGGLLHETELLAEAGIPPLDIVVAATRNGAAALGKLATEGVIQPGKVANLLLLKANPGEDIRNLRQVALRLHPAPTPR